MNDISLEDFKKIDLKVAKIIEAEEVPGADRLYQLTIDLGGEKKRIVSGIKNAYSREALIGKCVVVVNNLLPAVIRGVESQGMLLAAKDGDQLTLVTLDKEISPGSPIS